MRWERLIFVANDGSEFLPVDQTSIPVRKHLVTPTADLQVFYQRAHSSCEVSDAATGVMTGWTVEYK